MLSALGMVEVCNLALRAQLRYMCVASYRSVDKWKRNFG
jgi:hypothetical protein